MSGGGRAESSGLQPAAPRPNPLPARGTSSAPGGRPSLRDSLLAPVTFGNLPLLERIGAQARDGSEGEHERLYRDLSTLIGLPLGTARAFVRTCAREAYVPAEPVDPLSLEVALAQVPYDAFVDLPTESSPPRSPPPPDVVVEPVDPGWVAALGRASRHFPWIDQVPGNAELALRVRRAVSELVGLSRVASSESDSCKEEAAARLSEIAGRAALSKIVGQWGQPSSSVVVTSPQLTAGQVDVTLNGLASSTAGPPPPQKLVASDQPVPEETTVSHASAAGWEAAEIESWWETEKRAGRYENPKGREAARFLCEDVPQWTLHHPEQVDAEDCREIVRRLKARAANRGHTFSNNSARTYLDYLNSYLWRRWKNRIIRDSGVRSEYPRKVSRTPVATREKWNRVAATAVGPETVVVSFEWPNRRVEVKQARLHDVHLDQETFDARCKNGHDEVTDPDSPLTETQCRALLVYLPWRRSLASDPRCPDDDGHLLTRRAWVAACEVGSREEWLLGFVLVGVSVRTVDRLLMKAIIRAFPDPKERPHLPGHSFRRGGLTTLHDRSLEQFGVPDWESVQAAAHHKSMATTEPYVKSLLLKRRLPERMRLLDPPSRER